MQLETPAQWREYALERFRTLAREQLGNPWTSITLCVAQYWDDQANDAVHNLIVGSMDAVGWPHRCDYDRPPVRHDACSNCGTLPDLPGWHDDDRSIAAFAPWCREGANQDMEPSEAYLPVAIARLHEGSLVIDWVGEPHRPWLLDAPEVVPVAAEIAAVLERVYEHPERDDARAVLADLLLERRDPRGAFIVAQLAGLEEEAAQRLVGNAGAWSGPLAAVTAPPRTVFRRGFPAEVHVHFRDGLAVADFGEATAWGTVECLHWTAGSTIHYPDTLRALRAVHGQPESSLWSLCGSRCFGQLETLGIQLDAHQDLEGLEHATSLRALHLGPISSRRSLFDAPVPWAQLSSLSLWVDPSDGEEALLEHAVQHGIAEVVLESAGLRLDLVLGLRARLGHGRGWAPGVDRERLVTRLGQWLRGRPEVVELDLHGAQALRLRAAFGS